MTGPAPQYTPQVVPVEIGAVVSLREIYDAVIRQSQQIATMQQQLTQLIHDYEDRDRDNGQRFAQIEKRLDQIEARRWPVSSIVALTTIAGVVVAAVALFTR